MLQRIGLAQALLGRPELVFLDEPASGLDPVGVAIVRRAIGAARASGATVVLNSHQLDEVERVCDRVAFLEGGRVQSMETLGVEPACRRFHLIVGPGRAADAAAALCGAGIAASVGGDGSLEIEADADQVERVAPVLVGRGIPLRELTPERARLEPLFFSGERRG
jgi:ABC-2 type transport system ATP-binding protein